MKTDLLDDIVDSLEIIQAIDNEVDDFIFRQKRAYGIEYSEDELFIQPAYFKYDIEEWLLNNPTNETDPDTLAYLWLQAEGFEKIENAIGR